MIYKRLFFLIIISLLSISFLYAEETDSIIINKLNKFTDTLVTEFESGTRKASVAVAEFENKSEKATESNIGFVVADIISQRLSDSDNFIVIENSQVEKLIENMQMGLTGLYDEKTVASVGHLVGAEYMVIGSISDIGGFYRLNTKVIKIETGVTVVNKNLELDSELLEKESEKYLPPKYRIMLGTAFSYYPQDLDGYEATFRGYNLGASTGIYYDIAPEHTLSVLINYYLLNMGHFFREETGLYDPINDINSEIVMDVEFTSQFEFMLGYGYNINLSKYLTSRINLYGGIVLLKCETINDSMYDDGVGGYYQADEFDSFSFSSFFISPTIDFIINSNNPLSFILSTGYRYVPKDFILSIPEDYSPISIKEKFNLSGFILRLGLQMYI